MTTNGQPETISTTDAAAILGVVPNTVIEYIGRGYIKAERKAGSNAWACDTASVMAYAEKRAKEPMTKQAFHINQTFANGAFHHNTPMKPERPWNTVQDQIAATMAGLVKPAYYNSVGQLTNKAGQRIDENGEVIKVKEISDEEIDSILNRIRIVRPLIIEDVKRAGAMKRNVSGQIDCPICKTGKVNYSRAGNYNGHVSAECTTADCVRWIE